MASGTDIPSTGTPSAEAGLVRRAQAGDQAAFANLYDRYFEPVYDFLVRTLRSEADAADATQEAFIKAMAAIGSLQNPDAFRGWLFTIARNAALMAVRAKRPVESLDAATNESEEMPPWAALPDRDPAGSPSAAYESQEAATAFWQVAASLDAKQYTILDLSVRRELDAAEMAEVLGISRNNAYVMVNRTRTAFAEAALDYLDFVKGRRECLRLERELRLRTMDAHPRAMPESFSKDVRRTIAKHVKRCDDCQERRKAAPAPLALFGSMALIPAPMGMKSALRDRLANAPIAVAGTVLPVAPAGRGVWRAKLTAIAVISVVMLALLMLIAVRAVSDDTAAARIPDPDDVHSVSHTVGQLSTDPIVQLEWTPRTAARGYSIVWTHEPHDVPDAVIDLAANSSRLASPSLEPGEWFFHLRTASPDGQWTSTVHLGPFIILATAASPSATAATPSPASTVVAVSPTPTPQVAIPPTLPATLATPSALPTQPVAAATPAPATPEASTSTPTATATATTTTTTTTTTVPATPSPTQTPPLTASPSPSPAPTRTSTPSVVPPTITSFSCAPLTATKGTAIHCSLDADGDATGVTWTAPGGSPASASGASDAALFFTTSFVQPGSHTISVNICNGTACSTRRATIEVQ